MTTQPFEIDRHYNAPVAKVWKALTSVEDMKKWYFDVQDFRPEPGCEFHFTAGDDTRQYVHLCKVIEVIPEKKISYTWRYADYTGDTLVTWELTPEGSGTRLKLTHEGLENFPKVPELAKENFAKGWTGFFDVLLKNFLEG